MADPFGVTAQLGSQVMGGVEDMQSAQLQNQQLKKQLEIKQNANNSANNQQIKQTDALLQKMGFVKHDIQPLTSAELEQSLKENAMKAGTKLNLNLAPGMDEKKKTDLLSQLHQVYGFEMPKPKVSTTVSVDKDGNPIIDYGAMGKAGVKADYQGVSVSPGSQPKSVLEQATELKQANKILEESGLTGYQATPNAKGQAIVKPESASEKRYVDTKEDAKAIVDEAVKTGKFNPKGLYAMGGKVQAEAARRGIDLIDMQNKVIADQKLIQTLNGPKQVAMRQSIENATDQLGKLEELNSEFDRTGVKWANKAQLEALANGAGTKEQQEVAQRFVTQSTLMADQLGSLFMGGNSATDKSIELGLKTVGESMNDTSVRAAIKQLKVDLIIRKNALENTAAIVPGEDIKGKKLTEAAGLTKGGNDYDSYLKAIGGQ